MATGDNSAKSEQCQQNGIRASYVIAGERSGGSVVTIGSLAYELRNDITRIAMRPLDRPGWRGVRE
jgi:hypothetical protein